MRLIPPTLYRLYEFSKEKKTEKLIKITSGTVPSDILPFDEATIHDIKVNGYGPDDEIYSKNPDIRQKVSRSRTVKQFTLKSYIP